MKHLVSVADLTREDVLHLFEVAAELKTRRKAGDLATPLAGRSIALIFEKPSLRTREAVSDVARNLSLWVDGIVARVNSHETVLTLARHAAVPVFNALSDREHPCQALADYFTLWERGLDLARIHAVWIGDGNNVCHSFLLMGALLGCRLTAACPAGYGPAPEVLALVRRLGGRVEVTPDPRAAATGADVLYTDVWTSMGQEAEQARRREVFRAYQLSDALVRCARPTAVVRSEERRVGKEWRCRRAREH